MRTEQARKEMVAVGAPPPPSSPPSRSTRHQRKPSLQSFLAAVAVISTFCLQMPVASAGDMIDLLHTKSSNTDNPNYVSSLGLSCAEHSELRCDKMGALGYDAFEVDELLRSCPKSCATSPNRLNNNDDKDNYDDDQWTGFHRGLDQSYTTDNTDQTCFDGYCQDDPGYLSKIGMPCERFERFVCRKFAEVGFTPEETDELVNNCPCACKEECSFSRNHTPEPFLAPTSLPTQAQSIHPILVQLDLFFRSRRQDPPSVFPTSRPSAHPSAEPSQAPTSHPTVTPSVQPSDNPSSSPTSNPSAQPTGDPTVTPSQAPTSNPTVTPNVQLSDSPSFLPTLTPSARPTPAPHNQPSQAPTSNPTPAPSNQPTYEIDLLHVEKRSDTPIKQLSTPDASGANDSFVNKPKSTNTLYLVLYIVAGVAFVGIIYKYIEEERKSVGVDGHSISSIVMSGSSVEKTRESGLNKVGFQVPPSRDKRDLSDNFTEEDRPIERKRSRSRDRVRSKEREEGHKCFFQTTGSRSCDSSSLVGSSDSSFRVGSSYSSSLDGSYTDEENGSGSFTTASSLESKRSTDYSE